MQHTYKCLVCSGHCDRQYGPDRACLPVLQEVSRKDIWTVGAQAWVEKDSEKEEREKGRKEGKKQRRERQQNGKNKTLSSLEYVFKLLV